MVKNLIFNRNLLGENLEFFKVEKEYIKEDYDTFTTENIFYCFKGVLTNESIRLIINAKYDIQEDKKYLGFTIEDIKKHDYIIVCDDFMEFKEGKDILKTLYKFSDKKMETALEKIIVNLCDVITEDIYNNKHKEI